jgi:hypothetical protein
VGRQPAPTVARRVAISPDDGTAIDLRSPALAAMLTFICLLALTAGGGLLDALPTEGWEWLGWLKGPADHLRSLAHLEDFAAGIIDTRPLALYATGSLLCLGLTTLAVEASD